MDPLIVAQANEAIARTGNEVQAEAYQFVEQAQNRMMSDAAQFSHQVQSQASLVVGESHAREVQAQNQLAQSRQEIELILAQSRQEIELIRNQARGEVDHARNELERTRVDMMNVKKEAQMHIATLEGKVSELVQLNSSLTKRIEEQSQVVETLLKRVEEQSSIIASLRMSSVELDPNGAGLGVSSQVNSATAHFSIATPKGGKASDHGPSSRLQPAPPFNIPPNQDARSSAHNEMPLGTVGQPQGNWSGYPSSGMPRSQVELELLIGKIVSSQQTLNKTVSSVAHQSKKSSPPGSPSSSSSSSGSRGRGGGSRQGGRNTPKTDASQSPQSQSSQSNDPYKVEKSLMRVKHYDSLKLPSLPKNASEARSFRNAVFNAVCKLAKGDENPVFMWVQKCMSPRAKLDSSLPYPVLDRVLGSKLLELSKGTRFASQFQTVQEEAQKTCRQPKGRFLLWIVFEKYKMERDKGVALTQNHLLNLKMNGTDVRALEDFRQRYDYIWQALEIAERPSETAIKNLLFEQLKSHPKLQLAIDKYRNSSSNSSKRSSSWLYGKMIEVIEIHQLEENSANVEKSLVEMSHSSKPDKKVEAGVVKPKKDEKAEKEKEKAEKPKNTKKEGKEQPEKKEKGGKEQQESKQSKDVAAAANATKGAATVQAGVGHVIAGAVEAGVVKPKKDEKAEKEKEKAEKPKNAKKERKEQPEKREKGAGRNLISKKDLPESCVPFLDTAPEKLKFSTGGGIRNSSEAVRLRGEQSGDGIFYALPECPAALSLGQQVNEQGKGWVWFPNQLPFFIKPERLADVTFHCPESAKIYADRVVENVPILHERVECVAMPAEPASLSRDEPAEKVGPGGDDDEGYEPSIAGPDVVPGDPKEILELLGIDGPVEERDAVMKEGEEAPGIPKVKSNELIGPEKLVDFWEFDESKSAWKFVHNRPRKRLFAPVGKDCPFDAKEITAERLTEWKCRGGHVAFEWPRGNAGWKLPELVQFIKENNLFVAEPDGCALGIHMLLDRKDWHKHEGAKEAIQKELEGILANGTWSFDDVIPRAELMKRKEPCHIGRIMTILSIKHFESPSLRKLKARVVFRGDQIRDGDGNLAVLMDSKVCPAGMSAINGNLAFGAIKGNKTTQSDVVRAYLQSKLETKVPTYVELPSELVPEDMKHVVRPCVRLWRSLYGHPESGFHWNERFKSVMSQMNAVHLDDFPSNYWLPSFGLLLSLYVDDILVSGPTDRHAPFWEELRRHLEIDEPTDVNRALGRGHEFVRNGDTTTCTFEMTEFIDNACSMYEELSGRKLKPAPSPYVPEGSLTDDDWDNRGTLCHEASRVLMKVLWCARLSRPDLMKGIADLTRRLTVWARADDKRLHRLMSYLYGSKEFRLKGQIADPADKLYLCLYTDADHCSAQEDTKSSSGMYLTLEGPSSFWPLSWASKKQSATARSTTEAEMISLGSGLFSEAIPMQEYFECILQREVSLFSYQDNSAVIQIVETGYSAKLRHLKKVFKLNIGSIHEFFCENETALLLYIKTSLQRADPFTKPLPLQRLPPAQSCDTFRTATLPLLAKFGLEEQLSFKILKRGAPPLGGGEVVFSCPITKGIQPIELLNEGKVKRVRGVAYTTKVSPQFAARMVDSARAVLNDFLPDVWVYTDHCKGEACGNSPGYGISLVAETIARSLKSADACASLQDDEALGSPEAVGSHVAERLLAEINLDGVVQC
eukprot:s1958_g3.t1